jgi:hypothetical protein
MMCNEKDTNCIAEILGVILVLQQNVCGDSCLDSCDRPMLGGGPTCLACNTRPVMIYTCGGGNVPWSMPTTKDSTATCDGSGTGCSNVFRVEKLEGNCCTFRVLQDNPDTTSLYPYTATNSVFTISLDCVCALRCLTDTYVECI